MKKLKIGTKVKIIKCNYNNKHKGVGKIIEIDETNSEYYVGKRDGIRCWASDVTPLKSSPKVTKKVKKEEVYREIKIITQKNGFTIHAFKLAPTGETFVFNTKLKMLKWLEKHTK